MRLPELIPYRGAEHLPFEIGEGQSGVLLLHGFTGTPAEMRPLGDKLAQNGLRSVGILLPGFGPDIVNLNRQSQQGWLSAAEQAWQNLQSTSPVSILVGYSMGAAIAIQLALTAPPDLLVLISPFWKAPGLLPALLPIAKIIVPNLRPFRRADFSDPRLRHMFSKMLPSANLDDARVQQTIRDQFVLPLAAMHEVLQMGKRSYQLGPRLQTQILVIQGKRDPVVRPQETRKLVSRLPSRLTKAIEVDAGHDLIMEGSTSLSQVANMILEVAQ
jgi:carboxylesterase